jgi:enoyl-[acyl-carrier protein] reductase I
MSCVYQVRINPVFKFGEVMMRFNLNNKKALIIGIANENSIAYGCADALKEQGAELAVSYVNDKAKSYVEPLAEKLQSKLFLPCDVTNDEQVDALFDKIESSWGKLDILVHSIAFAPKADLHGRLVDSSKEGFLMAMDVSCHSLMRLAKRAETLMHDGGSIFSMSYIGADQVVNNYNLMGPVKAALESSVRYLAYELGTSGIRVHAISPGPIMTRAASGLADFDDLIKQTTEKAPLSKQLNVEDVGSLVAFLASDEASAMTGNLIYIDCGSHIIN